jgi:hypothetical protein
MEKKPEYQISASVNEVILEIILTGEVVESAVKNMQNEINAIIQGNGIENVLIDVRAIKGRFGNTSAHHRFRNYLPDFYRINFAFVDLPENADFESFQEVAAKEVGISFKWFTDMDTARKWLKSMGKKK